MRQTAGKTTDQRARKRSRVTNNDNAGVQHRGSTPFQKFLHAEDLSLNPTMQWPLPIRSIRKGRWGGGWDPKELCAKNGPTRLSQR